MKWGERRVPGTPILRTCSQHLHRLEIKCLLQNHAPVPPLSLPCPDSIICQAGIRVSHTVGAELVLVNHVFYCLTGNEVPITEGRSSTLPIAKAKSDNHQHMFNLPVTD